ncbi:hypothetical protein ABKN59_004091 [Abortiporus biennis]
MSSSKPTKPFHAVEMKDFLDRGELVKVMFGAMQTLTAVHMRDDLYVHGDISPNNIMVAIEGETSRAILIDMDESMKFNREDLKTFDQRVWD